MGLLQVRTAHISFSPTKWQHSTLLHERTSWPPFWNYDVKSEIQLLSVNAYCICNEDIAAKFHPGLIWNEGPLGVFSRGRPNKKNKMSIDIMRSVPDLKAFFVQVCHCIIFENSFQHFTRNWCQWYWSVITCFTFIALYCTLGILLSPSSLLVVVEFLPGVTWWMSWTVAWKLYLHNFWEPVDGCPATGATCSSLSVH